MDDGPYPKDSEEGPDPSTNAPAILSFGSDKSVVAPGDTVVLSWTTENAAEVSIAPAIGAVAANGSIEVNPAETTDYVLSAKSEGTEEAVSIVTVLVEDGPNPNACESAPQNSQELAELLELHVSPREIIEGEAVRLSWSVDFDSNVSTAELTTDENLSFEGVNRTVRIQSDAVESYKLSAEVCGVTAEKEALATVHSWTQARLTDANSNPASISVFYQSNEAQPILVGAANGSLFKSVDSGARWNLVSGPRTSFVQQGSPIKDHSAVNALLQLGSGCPNAVFIGTEAGFLYRSLDGGATSNGRAGDNVALASAQAPVHFLLPDPNDAKRVYVGYETGLVYLKACDGVDLGAVNATTSNMTFANTHLIDGAVFKGKLYVANQSGLFESAGAQSNARTEWNPVSAIQSEIEWLRVERDVLWVKTAEGLARFDGTTWEIFSDIQDQATAISFNFHLHDTQGLELQSTGSAWNSVNAPDAPINRLFLKGAGTTDRVLFAKSDDGRLFRLTLPDAPRPRANNGRHPTLPTQGRPRAR